MFNNRTLHRLYQLTCWALYFFHKSLEYELHDWSRSLLAQQWQSLASRYFFRFQFQIQRMNGEHWTIISHNHRNEKARKHKRCSEIRMELVFFNRRATLKNIYLARSEMCGGRLLRAGWRKQLKWLFTICVDFFSLLILIVSGQFINLRDYACRLMRARSCYTLLIQIDTNRTLLEFMCEFVDASLESDTGR